MEVRLAVAATVALAVTVSAPRAAEPCSPARVLSLEEEIPATGLADVPIQGVVPVFISTSDEFEIAVAVLDPDGDIVPGTFSVDGRFVRDFFGGFTAGRLIWRADAPLEPSTAYQMTISSRFEFLEPLAFSFVTRASEPLPAPSFTIGGSSLAEDVFASETVCCTDFPGLCEPEDCFATEVSTRYTHAADIALPTDLGRYLTIEAATNGVTFSSADVISSTSGEIAETIGQPVGQQCLTIRATNLADGQIAEQTRCLDPAALVRDTEAPTVHDPDSCDELFPPGGGDGDSDDDAGGCAVGGKSGAPPAIVLVLLAGLARRRQR